MSFLSNIFTFLSHFCREQITLRLLNTILYDAKHSNNKTSFSFVAMPKSINMKISSVVKCWTSKHRDFKVFQNAEVHQLFHETVQYFEFHISNLCIRAEAKIRGSTTLYRCIDQKNDLSFLWNMYGPNCGKVSFFSNLMAFYKYIKGFKLAMFSLALAK